MILKEIPREYEAVTYSGTNAEEVSKFVNRHGAQVEFRTNDEGVTTGTLHTLAGTENIVRGVIVASGHDDQVFRIFPNQIGEDLPARYVKISDEARFAPPPRKGEKPKKEPEVIIPLNDAPEVGPEVFNFPELPNVPDVPDVPGQIVLPSQSDIEQRVDNLEGKLDRILAALDK